MTTLAEPEWDTPHRDLAVALDGVSMCNLCGMPTSICHDPELQETWVAGDPVRCHVHTARLARQKGVTEESNPGAQALSWPVYQKE